MIDTAIKALPEWTLEAWFYLALMSPFIIALLYAVCLFIVSAFKKIFRKSNRHQKNYNCQHAKRSGNGGEKERVASSFDECFNRYECDELLNDLKDILHRERR